MATVTNLYLDQGSFYRTYVTIVKSNKAPFDLTGYTVASQIRKSYKSLTAYNFTTSISSPTEGRVRVELTSEETRAIPAGRYLYDLEITSPSGERIRVVEGIILVNAEITKI